MSQPAEDTPKPGESGTESSDSRWKKWLKRGGIGVFLFFLLKGIGWLVVAGLAFFGLIEWSGCN